jgi:hypothetical protein
LRHGLGSGLDRSGSGQENLREGDHLKDPGIDGRILLKWTFERLDVVMDWINLAQDRDRWPALAKAVINLRFP